jgi:hypothetical protein
VTRSLPLRRALLFALTAACAATAGCSAIQAEPGRDPARDPARRSPASDVWALVAGEESAARIDLRVDGRTVGRGTLGEDLLRIDFSFRSYDAWPAGEDLRSTGTLFLPVGDDGEARPSLPGEAMLTEFPPGASASGLAILPEYGERPALVLGTAAAVVDLRGPVVRTLRRVANPYAPGGAAFAGEEQFGLAMLRRYQETADPGRLWEVRAAIAWLRAIAAVDELLRRETGVADHRFLVAGEGYGAVSAARAAASDARVGALALCGWPLDWADLHFTRWRRWERQARYYPLADLQPLPWRDSGDLLSFLFSSYADPDPGCPRCEGGGDDWRAELDVLQLWRRGWLSGVATLLIVGDSDPRFPLDLEARASVRPDELAAFLPQGGPGGASGPFSGELRLPFGDLRYLQGEASTLAGEESAGAVLAWAQHAAGYRDVPAVRVLESVEGGEVRIDVLIAGGNTAVTGVEIRLTEITDRYDSDFKWALHLAEPEEMIWSDVDARYAGPEGRGWDRWTAYFPFDLSRNRAYYVVVRDRVGELEAEHSLPARPLWNLGDPAVGAARF